MGKAIKKWWDENDGNAVLAGVMAVAAVCYFYYLTHELKNSDCFNEGLLLYTNGAFDVSLGRWLTPVCTGISGFIVDPLIYLAVYFVCDAIAAVILTDIWRIRGKILRILTGGIFAAAPAIAGQAMYIHEMPTYAFSLLFAFLSLYVLEKGRGYRSVIAAAFLFAMALGSFQSVIGMVFFVICGSLFLSFTVDEELRISLQKTGRCVCFAAGGVVIYWLILKVCLKLSGLERPSYAGVDEVSFSGVLSGLPHYIKRPYWIFLSYYRDDPLFGKVFWEILILAGMLGGGVLIVYLVKNKRPIQLLFTVIIALAMPLGANIIDVITPEHGIQLYMTYQMQLMAPFCIAVAGAAADRAERSASYIRSVSYVITCICMAGLIWSYCLQTYSSFRTIEIGSRHIRFCVSNALSHALEDDRYVEGMPIVFAGFVNDEKAQAMNPLRKYSYFDNAYPFWKERYEVFSVWRTYCAYYFGIDTGAVSEDQYESIIQSEEFKKMIQYPSDKAYAVINGCYVILMDRESVV